MSDLEDFPPIVIDNGSDMIKAGYSGDDQPNVIFPTIVGRRAGVDRKHQHVGRDAMSRQGLTLKYPIENGIVTNWDDMEAIWHYTFHDQLRHSPSDDNPVLLTETPMNPKTHRERITQIMFESFNVRSMYLAIGPVLSLCSIGKTTGLVFDSGHGVSHAVPIYEGYPLPASIRKNNIAGTELTKYLAKMLHDHGHSPNVYSSNEIVRNIKEELCYVALTNDMDRARMCEIDKTYQLPDGQNITIGEERFMCPEVLFNPELIGDAGKGIHQMINDAIRMTDVDNPLDIRPELYHNITLSGGSTMFEGLGERLEHEIRAIAPPGTNIFKVATPPERMHSVWIGGSVLSSLSTFKEMCITSDEYGDAGPRIVHNRRCS